MLGASLAVVLDRPAAAGVRCALGVGCFEERCSSRGLRRGRHGQLSFLVVTAIGVPGRPVWIAPHSQRFPLPESDQRRASTTHPQNGHSISA